nr:immunoglobulin heavy chain junction region [Macaca mulatta]MOX58674.1 immunoglobulin heavy chain junction region [Macaca mulatta]MOX58969.1 immunoglobulin heavy chain junction region [Macaca mulatta]MOX59247.1 immunoglobulin heavy chain junction region [Macaca mulatta]MOX59735.1 immunoglobulin heavy chain junction region [Macaca mulatta]
CANALTGGLDYW